jgi:hypothetical protein
MENGFTKPKHQLQQTCSSGGKIGGRTDSKPESKKAKKFHPNPENDGDGGLNTRWQEEVGRRSLQLKQALEQTGPDHMVQRIQEQLQQDPAGGFLGATRGTWSWAFWRLQAGLHRRVESES